MTCHITSCQAIPHHTCTCYVMLYYNAKQMRILVILQKAGISNINDIMNKSNGNLISHEALQKLPINRKINYIEVLQLRSSIPKNWMIILKQNTYSTPVTNIQNTTYIKNSKRQLDKVKCKIYYWHLINNIIHTHKTKNGNIFTLIEKLFLICHSYAVDIHQFNPFNTK